jgi:5,10-methylene-tetrahydrofolate dehydrogenase/methenyl tetrahydrofolate cyclohydrolase
MTTVEIKKKLIKRINDSENELLLEEIFRLMEGDDPDGIMYLSDDQKATVREGQEDYRLGRIISQEDLDREVDEWLKE